MRLFFVRRRMNESSPSLAWLYLSGEPVVPMWRVIQDSLYERLENEAEQGKPTEPPLEMVKKANG